MNDKNFTQEQFEQWLDSLWESEPVGICQSPGKCILAHFLYDTFGEEFLVAGTTYTTSRYSTGWTELPEWAKDIVYAFDCMPEMFFQDGHHLEVTKEEYLRYRREREE